MEFLDRSNVDRRDILKELSIKETKKMYGGGGISSALISALSRGVTVFTDLGRYLGSSLRRIFSNNLCDY